MMRRWVCITAAIMLAFCGAFPTSATEQKEEQPAQQMEPDYVEGQAIVKVSEPSQNTGMRLFSGGSFEAEMLADISRFDGSDAVSDGASNDASGDAAADRHRPHVLHRSGTTAIAADSGREAPAKEKILLVKSDTLTTEELIEKLEQNPEVEYAEPNYIFKGTALPDDPELSQQWYLQDDTDTAAAVGSSRAAALWERDSVTDVEADAAVPVVAVVDSGVDYEHPDLKNVMWDDGTGACGMDFTDPSDADGDGPMDQFGHGTSVAGIIGAEYNNGTGISGMSPQVKLMALKISDAFGNYQVACAVAAYQYILERKESGVNIIAANNSWGGYFYSRTLQEMFDLLGENGVISTAASGNGSVDHDVSLNSPEGSNRTMYLLVNASGQDGEAVPFSDYGLVSTDLYAPGVALRTTCMAEMYENQSGTSMAAPVAAGAVALLYDYYDTAETARTPDQQKAALDEIRARIAGGVMRTDEMTALCASGGHLNLKKAIQDPYPVLDALEQDGSEAAITGYFFGTAGTLEMDGKEMEVSSWGDRKITFSLPEGTSEGWHEFRIIDTTDPADGTEQYGRDKLWTEAVEEAGDAVHPDGTRSGTFFESVTTPDFTELGIAAPLEERAFRMTAYKGRIYVVQRGLHEATTGNTAILVYDEEAGTWSVMTASDVDPDSEIYLVTGEDSLYLVENASYVNEDDGSEKSRIRVLRKTEGNHLQQVGSDIVDAPLISRGAACDGSSIWLAGGGTPVYDGSVIPGGKILRFDLGTGKWIDTGLELQTARYDPQMEAVNGKLIITGGLDRFGSWVKTTEVMDVKTGKITAGANFPSVYALQEASAATGVYDGKMIVSGMWNDETHTADTYVYDPSSDKWETWKVRIMDAKVYSAGGTVLGDYFYVYGVATRSNGKEDVFRRLRLQDPPPEQEPVPEDEPVDDPEQEAAEEESDGSRENDPNKNTDTESAGHPDGEEPSRGGGIGTGDAFDILLWLTLMTVTATAVVGSALSRKKG